MIVVQRLNKLVAGWKLHTYNHVTSTHLPVGATRSFQFNCNSLDIWLRLLYVASSCDGMWPLEAACGTSIYSESEVIVATPSWRRIGRDLSCLDEVGCPLWDGFSLAKV